MIKKIDWYIIKKFLGTFVFIMLLLLGISIVIDIGEKIDAFVENNATVSIVVSEYTLYFVLFITSLIGPFFVLVSVIFFTSQLASRSEIIAILNSGTSFNRFLYPYFLAASVLVIAFYLGNNFFVPYSNSKRIQFERKYVSKPNENMRYNFHRMVSPGVVVYMENYKPSDASGYKFSIDKFKDGKLTYKLRSERIEWIKEARKWKVTDYYIREFGSPRDKLTSGSSLIDTFGFSPDDFSFAQQIKEEMTTPELKDYILYMYQSGQPYIEFYEVERYRRTASAFSIYILTLIGVSVASRKMRGGLGWHLVLGIGLSALYEIIMKFSITFATNASLPPLIAVWIPNILFGAAAYYLLRMAPK